MAPTPRPLKLQRTTRGPRRHAILVGAAALCSAGLSAVAGLWTLHLSLPATDSAAGEPFFDMLLDPFSLTVALQCTFLGAGLTYPLALWALRGTDLKRAVALVTASSVTAAALSTPFLHMLGALPALAAAVATLLAIRYGALFRTHGTGPYV